ncbi:magnesium transporter [Radicibacter daui]|uniref:magnesium transporter n=1 Tax=Radicibacter daui TaxID=3064829 RepID=UPI004046E338
MNDLSDEARPEAQPEDAYEAQRTLIRSVDEALEAGDTVALEELLADVHAADLADLLEKLGPDGREQVVHHLRRRLDPEVLTYLDGAARQAVVKLLPPIELAEAINELDSDDAVDLLEGLDDDDRLQTLRLLNPLVRAAVLEGLSFPEGSAGRLMQKEAFAVPMFWTVGKTLDYLRAAPDENLPEIFYELFVVDAMHKVVGTVPISRAMRSRRSVRIEDICDRDVDLVPATMDQDEVAFLFRRYGLVSAPVVDDNNRLLGAITVDDVVDVIDEAAEEDLFRLSGVGDDEISSSVARTTKVRFTWLGVNLLTAILASAVIGLFEDSIQRVVALAVLAPIVASMGGNAGTQTLTVAVRALATRELSDRNARRFLWKEVAVGLLNGVGFAVITGAVAVLWFHDMTLSWVIGGAMVINLLAAALAGTLIPLGLERIGVDPAVSSSVFLTTVTDCVGFFSFLGFATIFLLH